MELDGQRQRNALTAAERALVSLTDGDAHRARLNADKAAELDQVGVYAALPGAVAAVAADLEKSGSIGVEARRVLHDAVPPGPLHALLETLGS
jgi:hypothetical protein